MKITLVDENSGSADERNALQEKMVLQVCRSPLNLAVLFTNTQASVNYGITQP